MSYKIGIIGLPNAGKSTLFKAITKKDVLIAPYPFATIDPNIGIAEIHDKRLLDIAEIIKPKETMPASLEFVDIAGLIRGSHKGEGLGNQFLSHIRECNALVHVINSFKDSDPLGDKQAIKEELLMKDMETIEKAIQKSEKKEGGNSSRAKDLHEKKNKIKEGAVVEDKELQLLSSKPVLYLYNISGEDKGQFKNKGMALDLKIEEELTEMEEEDRRELQISSHLDRLTKECYNLLELVTFFTIAGEKRAQAWAIEKNSDILCAAERVHSDFKERFICAEVVPYTDLMLAGSIQRARKEGRIKTAGKEYIVEEGDIIEFKI